MADGKLIVASTAAEDRLFDGSGRLLRRQAGGPLFFIHRVLMQEGLPHVVSAPAESASVDIRLREGEEVGRVTFVPDHPFSWRDIVSDNVLISTLLEEVPLVGAEAYGGRIFLDAQGYVRSARLSRRPWPMADGSWPSVFCLKATEEECAYTDARFIEDQKRRILLVTRGARGVAGWAYGVGFGAEPDRVLRPSDTLGAGDSFFAYFVAGIIRNLSVRQSVRRAVAKTSGFLAAKRHHAPFPL